MTYNVLSATLNPAILPHWGLAWGGALTVYYFDANTYLH